MGPVHFQHRTTNYKCLPIHTILGWIKVNVGSTSFALQWSEHWLGKLRGTKQKQLCSIPDRGMLKSHVSLIRLRSKKLVQKEHQTDGYPDWASRPTYWGLVVIGGGGGWHYNIIIHPASRGVAAHTAGLFRSVRGAKNFHFPPPWGLPKLGNFHFPPPWGLPKLGNFHFSPPFSLFPPVGASQAREFSLFPAVTASQAMEFSLFPPLEALQAAEFQIARQRRLDSPPNPVFFECVSMFLQWFPSKHGTLHFCRHKTGRKHHVRQCFQFPYLPNRWKYRYLQCFLQFFHVPMPVANSNIYIYIYI